MIVCISNATYLFFMNIPVWKKIYYAIIKNMFKLSNSFLTTLKSFLLELFRNISWSNAVFTYFFLILSKCSCNWFLSSIHDHFILNFLIYCVDFQLSFYFTFDVFIFRISRLFFRTSVSLLKRSFISSIAFLEEINYLFVSF